MTATILVAIGGNRRHGRHGSPAGVVAAAIEELAASFEVVARSRIRVTAPMGPSDRAFANAMAAIRTPLPLPAVLARLKAIEVRFGRRRGRRWGPRVLDLDIVAGDRVVPSRLRWRGARAGLIVPHRGLATRGFVLDPLVDVAPRWRHPVLRMTARQLRARQRRPKRVPESP